jgi:hypothetical protein
MRVAHPSRRRSAYESSVPLHQDGKRLLISTLGIPPQKLMIRLN